MNPSSRTATAWAQDEDWSKYRTIITALYVNRGMKLKLILQFMAHEYNFQATQRMYKTRFKKWGLGKNTTRRAQCAQHSRLDHASRPVMNTSGARETISRFKRPVGIAPIMSVRRVASQDQVFAFQQLLTKSAVRSTVPPDSYRSAEGTFHYTQLYIDSTGFADPGPAAEDKVVIADITLAQWMDFPVAAKCLLMLGHNRQAVLLIDACCQQYRALLATHNLLLMATTVAGILKVLNHRPCLAEVFLAFVCTMSQVVLGEAHPLSMLYHYLKKASASDYLPFCLNATLRHFLGGLTYVTAYPNMDVYGDFYHDIMHDEDLNASAIYSELEYLQGRVQQRLQGPEQGQAESPLNLLEETSAIQCRLAWLQFYKGRYDDAKNLLREILANPAVTIYARAGCYDIMHDIAVAENQQGLALDMARKAVAASTQAYGNAHCATLRKSARLELCLRSMGCVSEADKVHEDWNAQLVRVCEKTR